MKEIQSPEEIPDFASEAEEAEFWATHSLGEEFLERMESVPEGELPPARPRSLKQRLRALDPDEFRLIAVGSREDWLRLLDYPESTMAALTAVKRFLADAGVPVADLSEEELEGARGEVRAAVDELLAESDPLEVQRMLRSERAHREEAEKEAENIYREWLEERVRGGRMGADEASERLSHFSEPA